MSPDERDASPLSLLNVVLLLMSFALAGALPATGIMPVAERFGVKSIPTILVIRGGEEVARLGGLIADRELTTAFDREVTGATQKGT